MECDKEEATRAKEIAIKKFTKQDYTGARKFTLRAQTLYPSLDGISQMLSTINVYISADDRTGGQKDLYGILGLNPSADDDAIKKQYRKLALQLHPDKNKSVGSDGAFQYVTEAFNILSDKSKRSAYDKTRHSGSGLGSGGFRKEPETFWTTCVSCKMQYKYMRCYLGRLLKCPNCAVDFKAVEIPSSSGSGTSTGTYDTNGLGKHSGSGGLRKEPETFWTICVSCKTRYEYMRCYLGRLLECPNCAVGFKAVEIPPPSSMGQSFWNPAYQAPSSSTFEFINSFFF